MQGSGTPERKQHEIAQIVTAHCGDRLDCFLHLHVNDADDPFRGGKHIDPERTRNLGLDRSAGPGRKERHPASKKTVLAEIAQDEVAIRYCCTLAAVAVTGGP